MKTKMKREKGVRFDLGPLKSSLTPFITAITLLFTLITTTAHAIPGITVENVRADFATALYNETAVDMRVKVMGGFVEAKRSWYNNRWVFNYNWADLKFEFKTSSSNTTDQPDSIRRNFMIYELVDAKAETLVWRFNDQRKTITKTASGYRWENREGDFKDYDNDGKILKYGNRNNVTVSFTRDINGQIKEIKDHLDKVIITYEFDANDNVSRIVDYSGREVVYTHDANGLLTNVKDVLGYNWKYGYTNYSTNKLTGPGNLFTIANMLSSKTNPEGHVTKINYSIIGGGTYCSPTGTGYWKVNSSTGKEEYVGDCVNITTPQSLILSSIAYPDGRTQNYTYTYYGSSKSYSRVVRNASNHLVEEAIDLEGIVTRRLENGKEVYSLTKDGTSEIVTDGRGNKTRTDFDQWRNPTKVTYADGSFKSWKYEPKFSNVVEVVNENGVKTKYEYDAVGNVTKMTEAVGYPEQRVTEYGYDAYGNRTLLREVGDAVTRTAETKWTYDGFGNIKTILDAESHTTTYNNINVLGKTEEVLDARKKLSYITYDNAGNILQKKNQLNHSYTYTYNKLGKLLSIANPDGFKEQYKYDVKGRLYSVTDREGGSQIIKYSLSGNIDEFVDGEGKSLFFQYDKKKRLASFIDGTGNKIKRTYVDFGTGKNDGKIKSVIYPTYIEEFVFDTRKRVKEVLIKTVEGVIQTKKQYVYDNVGNILKLTDERQNTIKYVYDALNRLKETYNRANDVVKNTYDLRNNKVRIKNENNVNIALYSYDRIGNLTNEEIQPGEVNVYKYDENQNLIEKQKTTGFNIKFEYDDAGRKINEKLFKQGDTLPVEVTSYEYNNENKLIYYDNGNVNGTIKRDKIQRALDVSVDYGVFTKSYSYSYYANHKKKSFLSPELITYQYKYNNSDKLTSISIPGLGDITYSNYKWHQSQKIIYPGGTNRNVTYDSLQRIKSIIVKDQAGNIKLDDNYTYDDVGNVSERIFGGSKSIYIYDDKYQLTSVDSTVEILKENFKYDVLGNKSNVDLTNAEYNESGLYTYNSSPVTHDLVGNIESINDGVYSVEYEYNGRNQLSKILRNNIETTFSYDPYGRRIKKIENGIITYFIYAEEGLIGEANVNGDIIRSYGFRPNSKWSTAPVFLKDNNNYYFYQNNRVYAPQKIIDVQGKVVWAANYSSFGKANIEVEDITSNLRLPGQYEDVASDIVYSFNRYYLPKLGRFISPDPAKFADSFNRYIYANNNPLAFIDESGLGRTNAGHYTDFKPKGSPQKPNANYGSQPFIKPRVDNLDNLADSLNGANGTHCQMNADSGLSRVMKEIDTKLKNTSHCDELYFRITWSQKLQNGGLCRSNYDWSSQDTPFTYGINCAIAETRDHLEGKNKFGTPQTRYYKTCGNEDNSSYGKMNDNCCF